MLAHPKNNHFRKRIQKTQKKKIPCFSQICSKTYYLLRNRMSMFFFIPNELNLFDGGGGSGWRSYVRHGRFIKFEVLKFQNYLEKILWLV